MSINLAVVYYSSTGTNYNLAKEAVQIAKEEGAEVRLLRVPETAPAQAIASNPAWQAHYDATQDVPLVTTDDLVWADAILFSMPTRFGNMPSQMRSFLDTTGGIWAKGQTVNKVVSAMSSAQNPHGGQEATILSFYTNMYHWGAIVVAPGYTDPVIMTAGGNPYGTSVTQGQDGKMVEDVLGAVAHQTRRVLQVASWLKAGQSK